MNSLVLLFATFVGLVIGGLVWIAKRNVLASVSATIFVVAIVALMLPSPGESITLASLQESRPTEVPSDGYVASDACRECHETNHASWYASYHRTMTQVATPEAVLGDFDNVRLSEGGRNYRLQQLEDVCWVELPNPDVLNTGRISAPIVMTTGSHHMQTYWYATGFGRTLANMPFVHLKETDEWIPRSAAFLKMTDGSDPIDYGLWNTTCSKCHATHGRERLQPSGEWDTQVAEFGISCEACHGPGEAHIAYHREVASGETPADPLDPIVNPESLSHVRSSQVCGQCHSVMSLKEAGSSELNLAGHGFRPGDNLMQTHQLWQQGTPELDAYLAENFVGGEQEQVLRSVYYGDGMVRVSGREYSGLIDSACYQRGEMSCVSCHQLHKSESDPRSLAEWANDQLRPDSLGAAACLKCHESDRYATNHTHHEAGSVGSNCYNCHMPHTVYGLLKGIRNHTISSPDVGRDLKARRPNACNACHLDKTLEWTAVTLEDWYGIERPELDRDQREVAASLLWMLKGDAAQRALAAWSMGWSDAQATSGNQWQAPFLAQLLDDPYPANRLIARRSLRTLPGLGELKLDVVGSTSSRQAAITAIWQRWAEQTAARRQNRPELLIKETGVETDRVERLLEQRDNTPINLGE